MHNHLNISKCPSLIPYPTSSSLLSYFVRHPYPIFILIFLKNVRLPAIWEAEWGSRACWYRCQCGLPRNWSQGLLCTPAITWWYLAKNKETTCWWSGLGGSSDQKDKFWSHLLKVWSSANCVVQHWQLEPVTLFDAGGIFLAVFVHGRIIEKGK